MQTSSDGDFKSILNDQDYLSKFAVLRPLKTKTSEKVAYNLTDIFCLLGSPTVLQSDNGRDFVNQCVETPKLLRSTLTIVHGKARHCSRAV